jgi:hypothetical protein
MDCLSRSFPHNVAFRPSSRPVLDPLFDWSSISSPTPLFSDAQVASPSVSGEWAPSVYNQTPRYPVSAPSATSSTFHQTASTLSFPPANPTGFVLPSPGPIGRPVPRYDLPVLPTSSAADHTALQPETQAQPYAGSTCNDLGILGKSNGCVDCVGTSSGSSTNVLTGYLLHLMLWLLMGSTDLLTHRLYQQTITHTYVLR